MEQASLEDHAAEVSNALLEWFARCRRDLPWRGSYAPYEVWISEVMLQQTQMDRGVSYFIRWMERFPSVSSVAEASDEEILAAWEGLGYYRRARMLHEAAKRIVAHHDACIPDSEEALSALPGLGKYTVAAILGIAFNRDVVCIDANVERIFSRLLDMEESVKSSSGSSRIRHSAEALLPSGRAREYDQALMELGALVCRKAPRCGDCPLAGWCLSLRNGTVALRPAGRERKAAVEVASAHAVFASGRKTLLVRRPSEGLWSGMWEFPGGEVPAGTDDRTFLKAFLERHGIKAEILGTLGSVSGNYTNHRLTARFYRVEAEDGATPEVCALRWEGEASAAGDRELDRYAMPAHHRKLCERFFSGKKRSPVKQLSMKEGL